MKKIVYFEDCQGISHPLGLAKNDEEVWTMINTFLIKHHYKAPYVREWDDEDGKHWYDVGSHSEFFYTEANK